MKSLLSFFLLVPLFAVVPFLEHRPANISEQREDGAVVEHKTYVFPPYEKAVETTDVENYADRGAYEKAVADANFELRKLMYMSAGLKVTAYLFSIPHHHGCAPITLLNERSFSIIQGLSGVVVAFVAID